MPGAFDCQEPSSLRPRLGQSAPVPRSLRLGAWLAALALFGYIVSVALTKDPRGPLLR